MLQDLNPPEITMKLRTCRLPIQKMRLTEGLWSSSELTKPETKGSPAGTNLYGSGELNSAADRTGHVHGIASFSTFEIMFISHMMPLEIWSILTDAIKKTRSVSENTACHHLMIACDY